MKVAVMTLTRDRLPYTVHCFETLHTNAGIDFDHYVLDQGSTDGTSDWLRITYDPAALVLLPENVGINLGVNLLLDMVVRGDYDVIVKVDNDCELLTPNTLRDVCRVALDHDALVSPRIHGLNNPPPTIQTLKLGGWTLDLTAAIGGIFLAAPARLYADGYRNNEANPVWGGDDTDLCRWHRHRGGLCGYLRGYDANHYMTTRGQWDDQPDYFARTRAEGKAVL